MNAHVKRLSVVVAGLAMALGTAACGDNVTGPAGWRSVVTETGRKVVQRDSDSVIIYDKLSGPLIDSNGKPTPGTSFLESCNRLYVGGMLVQNWNCTAIVNTGRHLYVAGAHAEGPFGELFTLGDPRFGGKLRIAVVGTPPSSPATAPFTIAVVAVPGGRG